LVGEVHKGSWRGREEVVKWGPVTGLGWSGRSVTKLHPLEQRAPSSPISRGARSCRKYKSDKPGESRNLRQCVRGGLPESRIARKEL